MDAAKEKIGKEERKGGTNRRKRWKKEDREGKWRKRWNSVRNDVIHNYQKSKNARLQVI